jgi:hypothetical protein
LIPLRVFFRQRDSVPVARQQFNTLQEGRDGRRERENFDPRQIAADAGRLDRQSNSSAPNQNNGEHHGIVG